jgi:predicted nucleotidyltransferase
MRRELLGKIGFLKRRYEPEGFIILGVFGSYARGEETPQSDLDILYELREPFYTKYAGWDACGRLEDIKQELQQALGGKIDIASRNGLNEIGRKYILPEVVYV